MDPHRANEAKFKCFTENEFNKSCNSLNNNEISLFHINIRSLNCNQRSLLIFLNGLNCEFDIIVQSEIWKSNAEFLHNIINGYDFYYELPKTGKAGGIGIFIKKSLQHIERHDLKINNVDGLKNIWLETTKNNLKYIIGGIYRHPNHNIQDYINKFGKNLKEISNRKIPCIIAGDMNIDLAKFETAKLTGDYLNLLVNYNFIPMIKLPTRITPYCATIIDHIYYFEGKNNKRDNKILQSGNFYADISDHLPNWIIISNKNKNNEIKNRPLIRLFTDKNKESFKKDLKLIDWNKLFNNEKEINKIYAIFSENFSTLYELNFPLIKLSKRGCKDKGWITKGIKISSNYKNKLYKKWITNRTPMEEEKYKKYKKMFDKIVKKREQEYYQEYFNDKNTSIKDTWKQIGKLCSHNKNRKPKNIISKIKINNQISEDNTEISNEMNRFFSTIGETLSKSIPTGGQKYEKYMQLPLGKTIFMEPTDRHELLAEIQKLNI